MFGSSAHIADLKAQIASLERLLEVERSEKRHLLDCLLQKHNAAPVTPEPLKAPAPPIQIISPFGGGATPEMNVLLTQSAIDEEVAYLMAEQNYSAEQARAAAEERFLRDNRT